MLSNLPAVVDGAGMGYGMGILRECEDRNTLAQGALQCCD